MSFSYISRPVGLKLTSTEEKLLENIDQFSYPLSGFPDLDHLHSTITVVLSDSEQPCRDQSYEIYEEERKSMMEKLEKEIDALKKEIEEEQDEKKQEKLKEKLSKKEKLLDALKNAKRMPNGKYRVTLVVKILGEYISSKKEVILYINVIRSYNSPYLLGEVYVHEMMHAYLDCGTVKSYFDKIEEPIAEYGMLNFFEKFDSKILSDAKRRVRSKQESNGIAHYGFGYCIFMKDNGVDFLDLYKNAKPTLVPTGPNVNNYLEFWRNIGYPEGTLEEFLCLVMLSLALQSSNDIFKAYSDLLPAKTNYTSPSGKDYTKWFVNKNGPYAKTEAVRLAVCAYISKNPTDDADAICKAWWNVDPNLIGLQKYTSSNDPLKRDERILLPNGDTIFVSNQLSLKRINKIKSTIPAKWGIAIG